MVVKPKRAGVRFQLGPLQKTSLYEQTLLKDVPLMAQDTGRDSGAPSPDFSPAMQPASIRLLHNQNRITILSTINDVLKTRAELENSRITLNRLHDELRARLRATTRENHAKKYAQLENARLAVRQLFAEKQYLEGQLSRMKEHLVRHEQEHAAHSGTADEDQGLVTLSNLPASIKDKKPSRKADQKLAAGRLLREVLQLRSRLALLERKLQTETRKKKQAEEELSVLRAAVNRNKGKKQDRPILRPVN